MSARRILPRRIGAGMRLLLVLPLEAEIVEGRVFLDRQACNGLRLWLSHFKFVTLACPASPSVDSAKDMASIELIDGRERLTFVPLPRTYLPHRFALALPKTARL